MKGKERILSLLDDGSFREIQKDYSESREKAGNESGGVVTGYGLVSGNPVLVFSEEPEFSKGTVNRAHLKKVIRLYERAVRFGLPVIGMFDSEGVRLAESDDLQKLFSELYAVQNRARGVVPTISVIFGNAGGITAFAALNSDFVLMENSAKLYLLSPDTIPGNFTEKNDSSALKFRSETAGNVDFSGTEEEIFGALKTLLSLLPSNVKDMAITENTDDLNRLNESLSEDSELSEVFSEIADDRRFFEIKKDFGTDFICGLSKMDGVTVGLLGNTGKPLSLSGLRKAGGFVSFLRAYKIPLIVFTDAEEIERSMETEALFLSEAGRFLRELQFYGGAKITVIMKKAFGLSGILMNTGSDFTYAYASARAGLLSSENAKKLFDDVELLTELTEKETMASYGDKGRIDGIIEPRYLRKSLLSALEILYGKDDYLSARSGK